MNDNVNKISAKTISQSIRLTDKIYHKLFL